jgi:hypothetical protein
MTVIQAAGPWLVAIAVVSSATTAAAQKTPVQSFADLQPLIKVGQGILVTDDTGNLITGSVTSIAADRLEIRGVQRPRSIVARFFRMGDYKTYVLTEPSVRRVKTDDSTLNGGLIGGAIGVLLMSIAYATEPDVSELREVGPGVAVVAGAGAGWASGTLIDDLIHRTVYTSAAGTRVSFQPVVSPQRLALSATVRF